jgi:hypothetical protein
MRESSAVCGLLSMTRTFFMQMSMMNGVRTIYFLIGLVTVTTVLAGKPMVIHTGQVLDGTTGTPVASVQIVAHYDNWPEDAKKPGVFATQTDSMGIYHFASNRPAEVLFIKSGYDTLMLHWPQEFEGSDRGGCDINLGPVRLVRLKK